MSTAPRCVVLIVAAGSGTRLSAGMPKALVPLQGGGSILEHCLQGVDRAHQGPRRDRLAGVVVVVPSVPTAAVQLEQVCRSFAERTGISLRTVPGGRERTDSVRSGLSACAALGSASSSDVPVTHVLVHDAARPFVPPAVFQRVEDALEAGAAAVVPAVPVTDTVKTVTPWAGQGSAADATGEPAPFRVVDTPARASLRAVQTPQGFELEALVSAHESAQRAGGDVAALTDDSMLMEAAGHPVAVVDGDAESFKITSPLDLALAAAVLQERSATSPQTDSPEGSPS